MRVDVELTRSWLHITETQREPLRLAISRFVGEEYADHLEALDAYLEVVAWHSDDSVFPDNGWDGSVDGTELWDCLAPYVAAGDYLEWGGSAPHTDYRVVFDGIGGHGVVRGDIRATT